METVAQEPPGSGSRLSRSVPSRSVIDGWDKLALVSALLLLVLYVPELMFPSWTPRFVVLLGLGPVGVALLVAQAIRRDAAAIALGAALVWTITAGLLGPAPRSALIGVVGRDLSALTVVLSAGFWAIGRVGTEQGRRILWTVVVWGAAANGALALLQVVFEVRSGPLGLLAGRPTGFVTNPVYLGALSAAGAAVGMTLAGTTRVAAWAPASALCGIAITLSGSRVALLAGVLTCVLLVVTRRSKDAAFGAVVVLASVVAGVAVDRLFGVGRNAADRLATGDGGGRTTIWRYGIEATLDRPLAGYGFGRFRPAVQDRFSIEFVRDFAPDEVSQAWFDPHNVLIGLLVAVGVIGTLLFAGWLATNLRSARGPLVWGLLPLGIHWMVQPLSLFTLPLAMLMLGAAMPPSAERAVPHRTATWTGGAVGLVAALAVFVGDVNLHRAVDDLDAPAAAAAATWFARDAVVDDLVSQVYELDPDASNRSENVIEWRRRAAQAEPDRPYWWSLLARRLIEAERFAEAEVALSRAYELQPNNLRTIRAEGELAIAQQDLVRLDAVIDSLCAYDARECDYTAEELMAQYEGS